MRALQAGFKDYISILLFLKEASEPAGKRRGRQNKTKNLGGGREVGGRCSSGLSYARMGSKDFNNKDV